MNSFNAKKIGFWIGIAIFIFIYFMPVPDGLSNEGKLTAAIFLLMGIWWATEAMPLYATALLPLIFFPLLGIDPIGVISREYMNKVQFLFAGGFMIGIAMQKWNLHKRIALNILKYSGMQAKNIVAAFMLTSAILSMWVMNTSTAIMLLPIGVSVIAVINETVKDLLPSESKNFQFALLLGIAYSASLGGISTPIGTSPNGYLIQYANDNFNQDIGFISWLAIGLPVTLIMVPLVWFILTSLIFSLPRHTSNKKEQVLNYLKQVNMVEFSDHYPSQLSGGQKARIACLRAIISNPNALLLDEPFSSLDKKTMKSFQNFLFDYVKKLNIPCVIV